MTTTHYEVHHNIEGFSGVIRTQLANAQREMMRLGRAEHFVQRVLTDEHGNEKLELV